MKRYYAMLLVVTATVIVDVAYGYYDPNVQRWINRDPLGDQGFLIRPTYSRFVAPSTQRDEGPNLYEFALNEPVNNSDAYGLDPKKIPIKFWRKCNATELAACASTCAPRPVKGCGVAEVDGVVVDSYCECGDPPRPPPIRRFLEWCKKIPIIIS